MLIVIAALLGAGAERADAKSAVLSFSNTPSSTQAGGHPDIVSTFALGNRFNQGPMPDCACNDPRDVIVHAPAGVIANPHVVSVCSAAELALFDCPPDSQVGFVVLKLFSYGLIPLYRTVPQAGQAALLTFIPPTTVPIPQYIAINGRTGGDYGLDLKVIGITHTISFTSFSTVFWGVPGAPSHDKLRLAFPSRLFACNSNPLKSALNDVIPGDCQVETVGFVPPTSIENPSSLPVAPFTQAPTTCAGPLVTSIDTIAYDRETDHAEAPWPATTGCDQLSFDPSISVKPTTTETDSPSGLEVDLKVPQYQDPNTPSPSEIRAATVTLPKGFSINANGADGKVTCSDAQANLTSEEPAQCPEFSKIGTTEVDSSALPAPISGYIYLGDPKPGDRYRILLTASGFGTSVKIAGSVRPDPVTGQIVTAFEDLPQAPFQEFNLHFFGAERGLLATPEQCGTYAAHATFTPWASELSDQTSTQFFTIDSGPAGTPCPDRPRRFEPRLQAGNTNSTAGAHAPLTLNLTRGDGNQYLSALTVKTPPGFAATLRGIPYCPEEAITRVSSPAYGGLGEQVAPACPGTSQVGTAVAGAGAGSRPLYVQGKVYLAGPHKGAPLSLLVVIPAVSGPYDLGSVAVRAAISVNPVTAQVTTVSDPLPQIIGGIPLRTRFIEVNLDRPGFTLNPTNCDPFAVEGTVFGSEGGLLGQNTHFQVSNCADLPFSPKLSLRLTGGLKRLGHPAIHAVLRTEPGEANTRSVSVTLPKGYLLDNSHIVTVCTRVEFARKACPAGSRLGSAEATTPLLDAPLKGDVYLRSSSNKLPDLAVDLRGQLEIELAGRVDSVNERLRTVFETVPDAPVSRFSLNLLGGKKGLLQNSDDICGTTKRASVTMSGQNGASLRLKVKPQARCAVAKRQKRPGARRTRRVTG